MLNYVGSTNKQKSYGISWHYRLLQENCHQKYGAVAAPLTWLIEGVSHSTSVGWTSVSRTIHFYVI